MKDHDWHLFDEANGYEIAAMDSVWHVRHRDDHDNVAQLTDEEFNAWRKAGAENPAGLD